MKTTIALIIKFIVMLAVAWISFMLLGTVAFWTVFWIAIAATVLNYLIGDLLILPRFGNIAAAVVNGLIGGALAWMILAYMPVTYYFMRSVYIFALIVALAEIFFHMYLISSHTVERKHSDSGSRKQKLNYHTETGNELYPYADKDNDTTLNSGYNKSVDMQDNYGGFSKNSKNKDHYDK